MLTCSLRILQLQTWQPNKVVVFVCLEKPQECNWLNTTDSDLHKVSLPPSLPSQFFLLSFPFPSLLPPVEFFLSMQIFGSFIDWLVLSFSVSSLVS